MPRHGCRRSRWRCFATPAVLQDAADGHGIAELRGVDVVYGERLVRAAADPGVRPIDDVDTSKLQPVTVSRILQRAGVAKHGQQERRHPSLAHPASRLREWRGEAATKSRASFHLPVLGGDSALSEISPNAQDFGRDLPVLGQRGMSQTRPTNSESRRAPSRAAATRAVSRKISRLHPRASYSARGRPSRTRSTKQPKQPQPVIIFGGSSGAVEPARWAPKSPAVSTLRGRRTALQRHDESWNDARVFTKTEIKLVQTTNVIADSPKGKIKGQTIVVGALQGPGINDNGSGTSTILKIRRSKRWATPRSCSGAGWSFLGRREEFAVYVDQLTEDLQT